MPPTDICVLYGPVIAIVVSTLKRVPFVSRHPKVIAAVLAVLAAVLAGGQFIAAPGATIQELARCVLEQFAAAVATFEVAKSVGVARGRRRF